MADSEQEAPISINGPNENSSIPEHDETTASRDSSATSLEQPRTLDQLTKLNPSFMQNQISIQRSPSNRASAFSGSRSGKSIVGQGADSNHQINPTDPHSTDENTRGRYLKESMSVSFDPSCTLKKSPSNSTDHSIKSVRSAKSVRSVHAVGSYPLGSLRVHSPSPTRAARCEAHECLRSGDVFVVRDVPAGALFGYDTIAFTIKAGEPFEGVRDIPPGTHFFWGGSGSASLRTGFWIMSSKMASDEYGEVHVKRWDKEHDTLDDEVSAAETRIQKERIPEFFDKLQPYILHSPVSRTQVSNGSGEASNLDAAGSDTWHDLTSCVKGAFLSKITGQEWNQWQVTSTHDFKPPAGQNRIPDDPLDFRGDEVLSFVFPKSTRTFADDSHGRDRTEQALDTSSHVMSVITGSCIYEDSDEIIGELQFCFVTGMILGNIACMEQWATIVKVVFKAYRLTLDLPGFFCKFIEAVHAQFSYDEEGLEGSILDHDPNLSDELKMTLTVFKSRLNELLLAQGSNLSPQQSAVGKAFEELESWLWKWDWDLRGNYVRSGKIQLEDGEFVDAELKDFEAEDERGEYAPVMVDLDEEGRERAGKKAKGRRGSRAAGIVRGF